MQLTAVTYFEGYSLNYVFFSININISTHIWIKIGLEPLTNPHVSNISTCKLCSSTIVVGDAD